VLVGTGTFQGYSTPVVGYGSGELVISVGSGYISNFRQSSTVIYTGDFTVPTEPLLTSGGAGVNTNAFTSPNIGLLLLTNSSSISGNLETNLISTGQSHVAVTYPNNNLYTFGLNSSGQLGDNTTINRLNPTLVGNYFNTNTISPVLAASASWSQASAGTSYSLAINADGTLWAWGLNTTGQLGKSDVVNRSSIVQVGSGTIPFLDSSGTIASITVTGSPFMIGTVSPYATSPYDLATYGGSGSFPGTTVGNYISIPDSVAGTNLQMGTGDFTIELWTYNTKSTNILFGKYTTALGAVGIRAYVVSVNPVGYLDVATSNYSATTGNYINLNTWHHIAIVRDSGTIYAYIDGIQRLTMNGSDNLNQTFAFVIGNWVVGGSSVSFGGYISDFRVVKGNAVYTTNFTPPTEPLPIVSGTTLLTLNYIDPNDPNAYLKVSAGHSTSVAVRTNNLMYAWGLGTSGQLGTNTVVNRSAPTQVGIDNWTNVTTGNITSAGIDEFGLLYVWGGGSVGQFGSSTIINRSNPTLVQGINYETKSPTIIPSYWSDINAGFSHTAGILSESLYTWGLNSSGQLGTGDTINRSSPSLVGNPPTITDSSTNNYTPISPSAGGQPIISTFGPFAGSPSAFFNNTAAPVFYYPNAANLQFGTGAFTVEFFVYLSFVNATPKNIINKGDGSGTVTGWSISSANNNIRFHIGTTIYSYAAGIIASTWYHVAVTRDSSNDIRMFVNGISSGVLVNSTYDFNQTSVLRIGYPRTGGGYNDLMRGYISNLRLVKGSALYTANFTPPTTALPVVSGTQLLILTTIATSAYSTAFAGTAATFVLRNDNNLFAAGNNAGGEISGYLNVINRSNLIQIGNNYISVNPSSPVQIAAGSWSKVGAGNSVSAAIRSDGLLFTWGSLTNSGQLGDGTIIAKSSPVQIGSDSWTQVSVYDTHMIGLTQIGQAYTWGLNASGQLGITLANPNGDVISRSSPTLVGADFSIIDVSGQNNTITKVGTNISTTVVPVAGSVSVYFNGISDYLRADTALDVFAASTDEFTIEGYVYPISGAATFFLGVNGSVSGTNQIVLGPTAVAYDGEGPAVNLSTSFTLNSWSHFAVSFDGTTARFFNNGQIVRAVVNAPTALSACVLLFGCEADAGDAGTLGNFFNGYLSNLRIVKQCLYTGAFTPPTGILTNSSVGTSGANVAASLTGTVSLLTITTQAATITGQGATYFNSVAAGSSFTGGVTTTGSLFMWGLGTTGQLGYGTAANRSSPVQVGTSSWTSVYAGSLTASALRKDSILFTWGAANTGQLGQIWASTVNRSSPVSVGNEYAGQATNYTRIPFKVNNQLWKAVNASNSFTSALTSNDRLFVWGLNNTGQLGLNDTINRSEPNQIGVNTYLSINGGTSNMGAIGKAT
jgi:alpha-tubulin suppressor-like RCC1 family protein